MYLGVNGCPTRGDGEICAPFAFGRALAHPAAVSGLSRVLAPVAAALMLFALGMTMDVGELRRLVRRPTPVLAALLVRWVAAPVVTVVLCVLTRASPTTSLGLLIVSACPVGSPAAGAARLGRGDTTLALALTALTGLASVLVLPLVLHAGAGALGTPWRAGTPGGGLAVLRLGLVVAIPILAGGVLRRASPALGRRAEPVASRLVAVVLPLLVAAVLVDHRASLVAAFAESGWRALTANLLAVGAALGVSRLAGLPTREGRAVSLSVGMFHFGVGVFVAHHVVGEPAVLGPIVVYGVVMWASAAAIVLSGRHAAGSATPGRGRPDP